MKKLFMILSASIVSFGAYAATCPQVVSGHGEASNYGQTYITLPCQMPGDYSVVVTANETNNYVFNTSGKSATGFTVRNAYQGQANRFDWIAARN